MLRYVFTDGLRPDQAAAALGVPTVEVERWIARLREEVRDRQPLELAGELT
ncbi:MAG: hypothetical protein R3F60_24810 [bacterium]